MSAADEPKVQPSRPETSSDQKAMLSATLQSGSLQNRSIAEPREVRLGKDGYDNICARESEACCLAIVNFACYSCRPESGPQMGIAATYATRDNYPKSFFISDLSLD